MSNMEGEIDETIIASNSFDSGLNEVDSKDESKEEVMEDKGDSNLGRKQLLLSQLGFEAKANKVRTEKEVNELERKVFTFELGVSREGR